MSAPCKRHASLMVTGWKAWLLWTLAMALLPLMPLRFQDAVLPTGSDTLDLVLLLIVLGLSAFGLVLAQWLVLRGRVRFLGWLGATVAGTMLGFLVQVMIFEAGRLLLGLYVLHALHGAAFGAVLGWLQARPLGLVPRQVRTWMLGSTLGWSLGYGVLDLFRRWPVIDPALGISAATGVAGAITGAVLISILAGVRARVE